MKNPLILLDEIDKISSDYKGDTASALLEVLDSEQNNKFRDHYVEIPIDLSEVLFIATANSVQDIPRPLLDRMELIEVSSYTENEKEHIAKEHLIQKQMKKNGLKDGELTISSSALRRMISGYTREAGVRNLEQMCIRDSHKIAEFSNENLTKVEEVENGIRQVSSSSEEINSSITKVEAEADKTLDQVNDGRNTVMETYEILKELDNTFKVTQETNENLLESSKSIQKIVE